jgi:hypothetical protein
MMTVRIVGLLALLCIHTDVVARADRTAIATIACVLSEFVHTCTPGQRDTLQAVVADKSTTADERALAGALLRVHHVADPADGPLLDALASDPDRPASVRAIANVIRGLVHLPTAADRELLASLSSSRVEDP